MRNPIHRTWLVCGLCGYAGLALGLGGCTGLIAMDQDSPGVAGGDMRDDTEDDGPVVGVGKDGEPLDIDCSEGTPATGETRIYRLTERQYENSVRELLGEDVLDVSLAADEGDAPSALAVQRWNQVAQELVAAQAPWMNAYVDCSLGTANAACAQEFVHNFASRAFRRPLTPEEDAWLVALWAALPADGTQSEKIAALVQVVLQAPQFLYLAPRGVSVEGIEDGPARLTDYELAERLSYFLWDSLPDNELAAAAASGALATDAGLRAQTERLLSDERAKPVLRRYLTGWMNLDGGGALGPLDGTRKDAEYFPEYTDSLNRAMRTEIESFMDYVMFEQDGSLETLFTDTRAYVNGPLASLYGVSDGPTGENEWAWVNLDPVQRAGILTRASFLTVHASDKQSSPIRRGVTVLRKMLCQPPPPPPGDVDNTPVMAGETDAGKILSIREQTTLRTSGAACVGCHSEINGIGFAFEHYDAVGAWQGDTERISGAEIDSAGALVRAGLADGPVNDAVELSSRILLTDWVRECAVESWFEQAIRRHPVSLDACSLQRVRGDVGNPGSLHALLRAFVTSDVFRYVNRGE